MPSTPLSTTRRIFLAAGSAVPLIGSAKIQAAEDSKGTIVVTGGHPGDPEYGCGGTIAKYAEAGRRVVLLYLNRGEKGCGQQPEPACGNTRTSEAARACQILGASPLFANQVDGEAQVDAKHYDEFRSVLTGEKPAVVFTHWPIDNHRDHRAISNLVYDAWLHSGKSFGLYYYEVSDGEDTTMFSPSDYVDVSQTESKKRAACFAHRSQAPEHFYALQEAVMRFRGTESGFKQAEAFTRHVQSVRYPLP